MAEVKGGGSALPVADAVGAPVRVTVVVATPSVSRIAVPTGRKLNRASTSATEVASSEIVSV